jgi:diguanylate cyclase (GGDEF)-like protein
MKKNCQLILLSLVLLSFIFNSLGFIYADDNSSEMKTVLFLNSYHKGYKWSDDIYDGIKSVLNSDDAKIELQVEYMDAQRVVDRQYIQSLFDTYKYKFKDRHFDLIISSDDAAFNFLLEYGDELFPGIPVVFCGVNYLEEDMLKKHASYTGVVEGFDIGSTIDTALTHHPTTETVYYVDDDTTTGIAIMKEFSKVMPAYKDKLNFAKLDGANLDEIIKKSRDLPENSIILYLVYFKDNEGTHYEYNEAISMLSQNSSTPIYGVWDFTLGYGIIGGKLTSGFYQGETAANIAVRVLNGENPSDIPVVTEMTTHYQFDYQQLKENGIEVDLLPQNSIIINLEKTSKKQILILNSYNKGLKWTDDLEIGIKSALVDSLDDIEFTYEFMDVQKNTDPVYLQNLYELLIRKYKNKKFDLIITTDDVAFKFIKMYHDTIYKDVPTIFCGVNYFEDSMLENKESFTGVVESYDLRGTINVALEINPSIKKFIVINDTSVTGQANKKNLDLLIPDYQDKLSFEIWDDMNMSEIQEKVKTLKNDSVILLLSFNRDKSNNTFSYDESIGMISEYASVPIYGVWDFYIGKGLLGGVLTSGTTHGQTVGEMALEILSGKKPSDIPVVINSPNIYMFDYKMLDKFEINITSLPYGSKIINEPNSLIDFYTNNKKLLLPFLYILFALGIILSLMYKNIRIRKAAEEKERLYALTDSLTGMPNRRAGIEHLNALLEKSKEGNFQTTVCFIDVNNLKKTNDAYGHREGDELIKDLCLLINSQLRDIDLFCRFGGDEFLIIFYDTNLIEAKQALERINETIKNHNQNEYKPYMLSISYGFGEYNQKECNTLDDLIEQADNAMYKNKRKMKREQK